MAKNTQTLSSTDGALLTIHYRELDLVLERASAPAEDENHPDTLTLSAPQDGASCSLVANDELLSGDIHCFLSELHGLLGLPSDHQFILDFPQLSLVFHPNQTPSECSLNELLSFFSSLSQEQELGAFVASLIAFPSLEAQLLNLRTLATATPDINTAPTTFSEESRLDVQETNYDRNGETTENDVQPDAEEGDETLLHHHNDEGEGEGDNDGDEKVVDGAEMADEAQPFAEEDLDANDADLQLEYEPMDEDLDATIDLGLDSEYHETTGDETAVAAGEEEEEEEEPTYAEASEAGDGPEMEVAPVDDTDGADLDLSVDDLEDFEHDSGEAAIPAEEVDQNALDQTEGEHFDEDHQEPEYSAHEEVSESLDETLESSVDYDTVDDSDHELLGKRFRSDNVSLFSTDFVGIPPTKAPYVAQV
eukprot:CAMPEP_0184353930 /NCGR_PEP_ID=MMETSP1089-20130417/83838_1 /TAXON_ID=38269 ORGANISM="Gloeochaete wittrockiana, Strain SAG46.84" /NCGR_SAMPLE_ID=MMETSP1089 /ASSEMBLY_ACC=CAM_ASM_000445 /LENGTH=420 /DNA_ID=CAMNT_0026689651 /DNA_START=43 /DNA_END=1305 /DNA_ORIENTATION=+